MHDRKLRDLMHEWRETLFQQEELAALYLQALVQNDHDQKDVFTAVMRVNSVYMDDLQRQISELIGDPDFFPE
jgi:hypothetical protein